MMKKIIILFCLLISFIFLFSYLFINFSYQGSPSLLWEKVKFNYFSQQRTASKLLALTTQSLQKTKSLAYIGHLSVKNANDEKKPLIQISSKGNLSYEAQKINQQTKLDFQVLDINNSSLSADINYVLKDNQAFFRINNLEYEPFFETDLIDNNIWLSLDLPDTVQTDYQVAELESFITKLQAADFSQIQESQLKDIKVYEFTANYSQNELVKLLNLVIKNKEDLEFEPEDLSVVDNTQVTFLIDQKSFLPKMIRLKIDLNNKVMADFISQSNSLTIQSDMNEFVVDAVIEFSDFNQNYFYETPDNSIDAWQYIRDNLDFGIEPVKEIPPPKISETDLQVSELEELTMSQRQILQEFME